MGQGSTNPRYTALLQASQDTILALDGETIVMVSPGSSQWAGQALEGRRLSEVFAADLAEQIQTQARQAKAGGKVVGFQLQLRPEH